MSQSYRLRLERSSLKLRVGSRIPSTLRVESPLLLDITGGIYTFSIDADAIEASLLPLVIDALNGIFPPITDVLQSVTASSDTINTATTLLAIQRVAPSTTALALPSVNHVLDGQKISIIDLSTSVTDHVFTLTPHGTETIMLASSWPVSSNSVQLGSISLRANRTLNGWYIAP